MANIFGPHPKETLPVTATISGPLQLSSYVELCSNHAQKKKFTPLGESYSNFFQKLRKIREIECIPPNRLNKNFLGFQDNERCEYHSGAPGHNTDNYWTLKGAIGKLTEHGVVVVTDDQNTPNVTNNPFRAENNLVGMACDD